ncbi:MAG: GNAT family protein [Verrucomicrobiota bacterium]|jgi:ribosomal-protein-serine acetyltransferase
MFIHKVNAQIELRLIDRTDSERLFKLIDSNRNYLRKWHPWVDIMRSPAEVEKLIAAAHQQFANHRGFHAGVWHEGQLCGMINHLNVDWANRWTALSFWLDEGHQGRGIMTECCRAFIAHAFETWKLNRITIECATENTRSRGVPERLGFKLEGVVRQSEWLHDRYVDHALYGLLKSDGG